MRKLNGYEETSRFFAVCIINAPEFKNQGHSLEEGYAILYTGLDSVAAKLRNDGAIAVYQQCRQEVDESLRLLQNKDLLAGLHRLQDAWETYKKIKKAGIRQHYWEDPDA